MSKHERTQSQENVLRHPSTKRAKEVDQHSPYQALCKGLEEKTNNESKHSETGKHVLFWFRQDLRAEDNGALSAASEMAKDQDKPLLTCFLFSPEDLDWHGESPARVDFILEGLRGLQKQLEEMNIPLVILQADKRGEKGQVILDFCEEHQVSHLFANFEYEPDELRRDVKLLETLQSDKSNIDFALYHDQTIVEPGMLRGSGGGPLKVFTPYHKAWLAEVAENQDSLFEAAAEPEPNDSTFKSDMGKLFGSKIPDVPKSKKFESTKHRDHIRKLWPPGHSAAKERLAKFLSKKVKTYAADRSNPAKDNSSRMSPYFSAGMISTRETMRAALDANDGDQFDYDKGGDAGISSWVRELVFREFYRHMMTISPHDGMNLPHNLKFDFVEWEDDEGGWEKWCNGTTGVPFVDAGMRQLRAEAFMHNRLRMNVASYLRTNMLIDYRKGERYFAENLIDWDLCNNTQGWEPSYTVFNPVSQAERNDPGGEYIRKWVPELKDVQGKAVFDPYHRLEKAEFEKLGYPKPHLDFAESKARCIQRYKQDMADADP